MKNILTLIFLACSSTAVWSQLAVGGSGMTIKSGTVLSSQGLVLTPSSDLTLSNNTQGFSGTAVTLGSDNGINRRYDFTVPFTFSGTLGIKYSAGELNGNTESSLDVMYNPATSGNNWVVTTGSNTGSAATYYVSKGLSATTIASVSAINALVVSAPTASAQAFCDAASVSDLAATGTDLKWYDQSSGGSVLSGATALSTGTYYVSQTLFGVESARTSVSVTINNTPVADDPADVTACDSYTLPALTVGNYFSGPDGTGTAYAAGNVISSDMTMYVYAETGTTPNCTDENSFTIDITATPTVTSTTVDDRCGTGTLDLEATASAGVINWFAGASGGASIGTGSPFTTPSISTTTVYYAEAMDGSCPSVARTAVTATVEQTSQVQASQQGTTLSAIGDAIIADAVSGATHYRFEVTENGNTEVITRTERWFYLNNLASYDYSKTYSIRVAVEIGGTYYCYGTAYNVSSPALPTSQVQASQCGATLPTLFTSIQASPVAGAAKYRFEVSSVHGTEVITNTSRYFYLNQLSTYTYGTAYTIRVSVEYNSAFGAYGASCVVKSPAVTTLQASQCNNSVLPASNTAIIADAVSGATGYKFEVTIDGVTEVLTRTVRWFYLANLSSYGMNKQLRVRVAVQKDGVWGPFYTACFVKTPAAWMAADETIYEADGGLMADISVEAYPNPNDGDFTINSTHEGTFNIINELGQLIQTVDLTKENNLRVSVEGLQAGVYFITGTVKNEVITKKVMVLK